MAKKRGASKVPAAPPGGWPTGRKVVAGNAASVEQEQDPMQQLAKGPNRAQYLVWRFADHDPAGNYALSTIRQADLGNLLTRLAAFETMTVDELFGPGGPGKFYDTESLPDKHAKARLTATQHDDEDRVHVLRCTGRRRLYGFLRGNVFHILWWDPKHAVFPSKKRHT